MRRAIASFAAITVALWVALGACGSEEGDRCGDEGKVGGECADGFVCGRAVNDQSGGLLCLAQCQTQAVCAAHQDCYAVGRTSLKGGRSR